MIDPRNQTRCELGGKRMTRPAGKVAATLTLGAALLAIIAIGHQAMGKEPRFPQLSMEQLTDAQKPLGEEIMKVSSVGLGGPYNTLLRSPVLGQRMFDLLHYLRWETSVPLKLNEFAILIIGRQWRSQVEWHAHAPLAIKAGLSPDIVAELKANKRPANMPPEEAAVYDFVTELTTKHAVSDDTFDRAKKLLGEQQVIDLTAVAGTYIAVAMQLAMAEQSVPAGKEEPLSRKRSDSGLAGLLRPCSMQLNGEARSNPPRLHGRRAMYGADCGLARKTRSVRVRAVLCRKP
jgi:4-carboxymuconolactone decarboxylase